MISRRAQLKGQDKKVSALTDDFTMRNFIAVGLAWLPSNDDKQEISPFSLPLYKNPSFMQENAYEPVMLNIPLLRGSTEGTSYGPEPASDAIVAVEDTTEQPPPEAREAVEGSPPSKKVRTIRFAE